MYISQLSMYLGAASPHVQLSRDDWIRELAKSHGKNPSEFPYDING